ncbi:hypothetical protein [Frankia gtarii]|nr:hypothetical protein [Frankia gtarii]
MTVDGVRTVNNHLQRAYGKLGVLRRTDLAVRLGGGLLLVTATRGSSS